MTPYTVTWQQYLEMLTGKAFPILPMKQFTELLQKHANEPDFGFLIAYFATLSSMDASMFPVERNRKTINKLTELGFEWEHPTAEYARFIL